MKPYENVEEQKSRQAPQEAATVLADSKDTNQDKDNKCVILETLCSIADLHEYQQVNRFLFLSSWMLSRQEHI